MSGLIIASGSAPASATSSSAEPGAMRFDATREVRPDTPGPGRAVRVAALLEKVRLPRYVAHGPVRQPISVETCASNCGRLTSRNCAKYRGSAHRLAVDRCCGRGWRALRRGDGGGGDAGLAGSTARGHARIMTVTGGSRFVSLPATPPADNTEAAIPLRL